MKKLIMFSFLSTLVILYKDIRLELQYVFSALWCKHPYIKKKVELWSVWLALAYVWQYQHGTHIF